MSLVVTWHRRFYHKKDEKQEFLIELLLFFVPLERNRENIIVMGFKSYFTGKSGAIFWLNILLMVTVLVGVPLLGVNYLSDYTHHNEKIEVPSVVGMSVGEASAALSSRGLEIVISDSTYDEGKTPGVILKQVPSEGSEVKSGRLIYLTKNFDREPLIKFPDLVGNSSLRETESHLRLLGFELLPNELVEDEPKDYVVGIKQGARKLKAGDMISKRYPLVICVGAGYDNDTIYADNVVEAEFY